MAGALLAWQLVPIVPKMAANFLPFDPDTRVELSLRVLGFTIVLSILTGLVMGIYPALQSSRADLVGRIKRRRPGNERQRASTTLPQNFGRRAGRVFCHLLAGAALLITSFVD